MADAYAQAHGGLAAVNVHVSPGLGNAMGMLYDAYKAHSPLLLTAGQHDQSFTVTEPILWSDLPPVATPFVKWATEARRLEDLPRIVRRAVKTALAQPSGPVFLSLPVDVHNAERDNLDLRSEEHTSELQSRLHLVCRLLLEKKKTTTPTPAPGRAVPCTHRPHPSAP